MRRDTADVVVIGAGIIGASVAWHLASRGASVVVLERDAAPAQGSTGRSAAGVRVQFTTASNIRLSMYSLGAYRDFAEQWGHDVGYRDIGYLLLVPPDRWDRHLESVALQRSLGAPVETVAAEDVSRWIDVSTDDLAGATFGPWDGVIDPHMAAHAYVSMARALGADFRMRSEVTGIEPSPGGWTVRAGHGRVDCGTVVNASGAWSGTVSSLAGLEVPVGPKRIQIFMSAPDPEPRRYPMTIDLATGVYLRSEGDRVLFGLDNLSQPFGFTEGIDTDWLEHVLLRGVTRFPWWEEMGVDTGASWWGYYAVTPDNSPIIGRHPNTEGWIDACGYSGHGIMHAPATGAAVSELILDGTATSVDVDHFAHDRFGREVETEANIF